MEKTPEGQKSERKQHLYFSRPNTEVLVERLEANVKEAVNSLRDPNGDLPLVYKSDKEIGSVTQFIEDVRAVLMRQHGIDKNNSDYAEALTQFEAEYSDAVLTRVLNEILEQEP